MSSKPRTAFSDFLEQELAKAKASSPPPGMCLITPPQGRFCQLCWASRYDYLTEAAAKGRALQRWARQERSFPEPQWLPAPQGRHYRGVSKRRWIHREKRLVMPDGPVGLEGGGLIVSACQVEPPEHAAIYRDLQKMLPTSRFSDLVNYTVLKGDLEKYHLLLNLTDLHRQRAEVNRLSKKITAAHPNLLSVWLVEGKAEDDYYLNPRPGGWERLYGAKFVKGPYGLHYSPLCFSQVNSTVVPLLVQAVGSWLDEPNLPLLDLYCGYGLFSLSLERRGPLMGLEISREAVQSAQDNARHRKVRAFFAQADLDEIDLGLATARFPHSQGFQAVVDPPRSGASPELIAQLAALGPKRVAHLLCDVETAFDQVELWQEKGYRLERLVALDMFPGTSGLEVMLGFSH